MNESLTLAELLQEHFDGVLATIQRGSWGHWFLDRKLADRGHLVLQHVTGYSVSLDTDADWIAIVSGQDWARASDIGELIYAMRDLEYARWLGILPEPSPKRLAVAE